MDLLLAMRIYVRIVERGSLSAAARDLGMGQPAVSERLNRLENHLGVRLLHRNTRSIVITGEGAIFYERCRKAIEAAAYAESVSEISSVSLKGKIRIAAPQGFGDIVLPDILDRFRKLHPQLAIELVMNDNIVDPVTEGADVSLRLGDAPAGSNKDIKIGFVKRVLIASPSYLANHGMPEKPSDLVEHTFMRVTGIFNDNLLPLHGPDGVVYAPLNIGWSLSTWRPLHALLVNGAGIGVLQVPAAAEALALGQLTRLLPAYEVEGYAVRLLYSDAEPLPEKTRKIVEFLTRELQFLGTSFSVYP